MTAVNFDTLKYVKQLTAAKVPDEQAEAQAEALRMVLNTALLDQIKMAHEASERAVLEWDTKTERAIAALDAKITGVDQRLDARITGVEQRLDAKITGVGQRLDAKIDLLRSDMRGEHILTRWMLGILTAGMGTIIVKLFWG